MKLKQKIKNNWLFKPNLKIMKFFFIILIFSLSLISILPFVSSLTGYEYLSNYTVSYWSLENDNFNDATGRFNFTNQGTTNGTGILGTGRVFNPTGKNLTTNSNIVLNSPFTFCLWLNGSNLNTNVFAIGRAIDNTQLTSDIGWSNTISWVRTKAGVVSDCTTRVGAFYSGKWTHICYSYSGSHMVLYQNGTLLSNCSSTGSGSTAQTNSFLVAGGITGTRDEMSYFNKTLSLVEVQYLYNSGSPTSNQTFPFSSPVLPSDYVGFINQNPSDITVINAVYGINITYNFTSPTLNVSSPYLNYTVKNSSGGIIYNYVNGTQQPSSTLVSYTNYSGVNYLFQLDDSIYSGTYNYNHSLMSSSTHYNYTLSTQSNYYRVELFNVSPKKYDLLEVELSSSSTVFVPVYYCNSSYSTGQPSSSVNCALISLTNFTSFNHKHNKSSHNVLALPVTNNLFNGVLVSPTSYFLIQGSNTGNAYIGYINGTPRSTASMYSSNNGNTWNSVNLIDLHLHYYNDNDYLEYTPYFLEGSIVYNGFSRNDSFNITILPPTGFSITTDKTSYNYDENMLISRSTPSSLTGNISNYTYNLYTSSFEFVKLIGYSNSTSYYYNLTGLSNEYYIIQGLVTDSNNQVSVSLSDSFLLHTAYFNPCNTTYVLNSTGIDVYFNYSNGTLVINQGLINYTLLNSSGNVYINNPLINGDYNILINDSYTYDTSCNINFCRNTWTLIPSPCTDNLRLMNYTHTCSIPYDYPQDYGQYSDCTSVTTDKELWFLLLLIIVWIIGVVLALTSAPIIIIASWLTSFGILYYSNTYFNNPFIGIVFLVITVFMTGISVYSKLRN